MGREHQPGVGLAVQERTKRLNRHLRKAECPARPLSLGLAMPVRVKSNETQVSAELAPLSQSGPSYRREFHMT
jgi:hypothetical protein